MKKKIVILNFLMSFAVLFAMLFQTIHSYEHVVKQFSEKHCVHKHKPGEKEITHSHATENTCHICHFAFSTFIPNSFQTLFFQKISVATSYQFFYSKTVSTFFKGSLFALRAPPVFI